MTTYNKSTLAAFFQTGDVPDGTDYANLIDSQINIVESSAQSMAGPLVTTELITPRVSALNINITGILSAATLSTSNLTLDNLVVSGNVSAGTMNIAGNTSAQNMWVLGDFTRPVVTIAASGTTLGTANILTGQIHRLTSVTDSTATGVGLQANKTGLVQYLFNETTTSANLWPCAGGQINVLASGAAFALAGSTLYTIIHTKASGYAVK